VSGFAKRHDVEKTAHKSCQTPYAVFELVGFGVGKSSLITQAENLLIQSFERLINRHYFETLAVALFA
jgi:hypothetical protein